MPHVEGVEGGKATSEIKSESRSWNASALFFFAFAYIFVTSTFQVVRYRSLTVVKR